MDQSRLKYYVNVAQPELGCENSQRKQNPFCNIICT